jgi:two-component system, cell cycle sensor histidine kinase and response regulator CckA
MINMPGPNSADSISEDKLGSGAFGELILQISSISADNEVLPLVADHLRAATHAIFVAAFSYDEESAELNPVYVSSELTAKVTEDVMAVRAQLTEDDRKRMRESIVLTTGTFSEATFDTVPSDISESIQALSGARAYQMMVLIAENTILGSLLVAFSDRTQILNTDAAEAIARVSGLVVQGRRAQREKLRLQESYQDLTDMLPEAVFETDLDGRITLGNQSALANFGLSEEDIRTGISTVSLICPEDQKRAGRALRKLAETGQRQGPTEYTLIRKDGSRFPALISTSVIREGNRVGLRGIVVDLSSTRHSERHTAQLEAAVEQTGEGILITDSIARILYVNPAFLRFTGVERDELIGQLPAVLGSGENEAASFKRMWQILQQGSPWQGIMRGKRRDGSDYFLNANVSPVRGESGAITNYVAAMRDVSYERELEERYRQALKMEAIARLAGGIAHDFNNLMTAIGGHTELLKDTFEESDRRYADADQILEAVDRATSLTDQLLAFSRKQIIQPKRLNIADVVSDMRGVLQRLLGEHIALSLELEDGLPDVAIDPNQLEQVVLNLATNAREALGDGGGLTIQAQTEAGPDCGAVLLVVTDNGSGMDPETVSHIFEPFFTTKDAGQGAGLGLATVHGIVEQNLGTIAVSSSLSTGTVFTIRLPALERRPGTEEEPSAETSAPKENLVLLVEDEELVRTLTAKILRQSGYEVLDAESPAVALELVRKDHPVLALVITDVVMPGMTGKDLADQLTILQPGVKILFMSGYTNEVISSKGIQDGSVHFLQKPFSPTTLMNKIDEVLSQS